jgi:ferric-dicitrate binding protein FerR (iron transport regulator)
MKAKHEIKDREWELIAKSIYDGEPSSANEETENVVSVDVKEREEIAAIADQVDLFFNLKKYRVEDAWVKVESRIQQRPLLKETKFRSIMASPVFRIAAAVLVAALLLVSGYAVIFNPSAKINLIEVSAGSQVLNSCILPDGTLVSLNSNTKLNYPEKFGKSTREVTIEGEAFFEVKPDKNKPFIIHAGNARIKVLGTSFNVNAYPESKQVEVTVETGRVQFLNTNTKSVQSNELILTPGDKGTLIYASNSLQKTSNQNPNFISWKTHNLIFKATSLSEVIQDLSKVYKVDIRIADPELNKLLLSAQFNNYSLDFILEVIETTLKVEIRRVDGQYILKARS